MSIRALFAGTLFVLLCAGVTAQVPASPDEPLDIDSLFGDPEAEEPAAPAPPPAASPLLDRVLQTDPIRVRAEARAVVGYSPGWTRPLGTPGGEFAQAPVLDLRSSIDLLLTVSPALRISQKLRFTYPDYAPQVTELALEYAVGDTAFVTVGQSRVNWGRSPSFAFANLPHRRADTPLSPANDRATLITRVVVPVGIGGVELLLQNKAEYHENPSRPRAERIGIGALYNLARERLDIEVGAFYQRGLKTRLYVSGTTTLSDSVELYLEGVVAHARLRVDDTGPYAGVAAPVSSSGEPIRPGWVEVAPGYLLFDNNPDYAAALGVVVGLFENNLDLNAEYYYNGEETELRVSGSTFPLYWGHNLALNTDWKFPGTPLRLRVGYRYNHFFDSHFLSPRLTVDVVRHVTLDLIGGLFWGPADAGHRQHNPDTQKRPTFLTITLTAHGRL